MKILNRYWVAVTTIAILILLLFYSSQGFDFTDEGFCLVAYQNFFCNPDYASYFFGRYLTGFVGGIWETLFSQGGWYSFRILNIIVIISGYLLVCFTLKDYMKYRWVITLGFFIVLLDMLLDHGTLVFHYYTFSALGYCLVTFFLYKAFATSSKTALYVSAVLLGINIFVRIPNATLCIIPYVLLIIDYIYQKETKAFICNGLIVTGGIFTGVACMLAVIGVFGHFDLFIQTFQSLTDTASDASQTHGILNMATMAMNALTDIFLYVCIILPLIGILLSLNTNIIKNKFGLAGICILCATAVYLLYRFLPFYIRPMAPYTTWLIATCFCFLIVSLIIDYKKEQVVLLAVTLMLTTMLQPMGSDGYIGNMGAYSIWTLIPGAAVVFLSSTKDNVSVQKYQIVCFSCILLLLYTGYRLGKQGYDICYRDEGNRFEKTYRINHSAYATVYTSRKRGGSIDSLLAVCSKHIKEGDVALFAADIPGLHYLTRTKPYSRKPWLRLYPAGIIKSDLAEADKQEGRPIIVVDKTVMYHNGKAADERRRRCLETIFDYISKKNYTMLWENDDYKVYK